MKPLRHCFFIQSAAAVLLATMIHRISADDAELTRLRSLNTGSIYSTGSTKIPDSYIVLLDDDTPEEDVQLAGGSGLFAGSGIAPQAVVARQAVEGVRAAHAVDAVAAGGAEHDVVIGSAVNHAHVIVAAGIEVADVQRIDAAPESRA